MADRPASAASIRTDVLATPLVIRVIQFEFDFELVYTRSVTSDGFTANGSCTPRSVFESTGGIIRGTCYVDPADATQMGKFNLTSGPVDPVGSTFEQGDTQIIRDLTESARSRRGYNFGTPTGDAMFFPLSISGETNEAGMQEMSFEIHSQKGVVWSSTI